LFFKRASPSADDFPAYDIQRIQAIPGARPVGTAADFSLFQAIQF
jgi:hypothetical protein